MTSLKTPIGLAAVFLAGLSQPALADDCIARFTEIYMQLDQGVPTKTVATTQFKGAPATVNDFLFLSQDHHMTVPTNPAGPWVLTYQNVMYQSADEGKSWTKVRDLDSAQNAEGAIAAKKTNAETIRNASCGEDSIDGVSLEKVAADLTVSQGMVTENRYTYWLSRDDGFIVKALYETTAPNFEMVTTQTIEAAPELSLPTPQ
ncbi:hypothetical protein [Roseibium sp. MMSF_3412]|uniref:hypothetical protein n=1 Tax=Roseibium sp. MMSF_3412 TaxID=3046712 RepID=UPI00273DF430|nr:hypothetical protein [Roseibium sp. MMSF_3412]